MKTFTVRLRVSDMYPTAQVRDITITYNGVEALDSASAEAEARYHFEETSYYEGGFLIVGVDIIEGETRGKPLVSTEAS